MTHSCCRKAACKLNVTWRRVSERAHSKKRFSIQNTPNSYTLTSVQCIILGTHDKKYIGEGKDGRTGLEVETRQVRARIRGMKPKYEKIVRTPTVIRTWSIDSRYKSSHFFNTILMLEALASLHLFLAVYEVLCGGLTLG